MSESVRVTFFGTAAGYPTKRRRNTTSVGVWRGEALYLLDAGAGAAGQLALMEVDPEAPRAIFISHTHADHISGLTALLQALQLQKRRRPLVLCLPGEAVEGFNALLSMCYLLPEWLGFDLEIWEVAEGRGYEAEGVAVDAIPSRHLEGFVERLRDMGESRLGESFSYAVEAEGKRVLFTADLAHSWEVPERIAGAELGIVELAHFSPEELGEALKGVALPRLAVTHLPRALEAEEDGIPERIRAGGYEGEVIVAQDGMEIEV
jgi:ribonuclease Z